jgi:hypothetical protein
MDDTIEEIREHVLWQVDWNLKELRDKADVYEQMQGRWEGSGLRQAWASMRLAQLRPKVLWWNEIKLAIESNDPNRTVPALERLIRHYRPSKFYLTWIAPISPAYWEVGMGPVAKAAATENIWEATALRDYYRQQAA